MTPTARREPHPGTHPTAPPPMASHTYADVASSWTLWQQYVDLDGVMTLEEFEAMSHADRVALQVETFGPEPEPVPTVDEVLARCRTSNGRCRWTVEGGAINVAETGLRRALEAAYDSTMPSWPSLVDLADA